MLYIHSHNFVHRDLKLDNILLDKNYNIKIIDFGMGARMEGKDGSGFLRTTLGTENYYAPELWELKPYKGHLVDIFTLGAILFGMYSGHPPFWTS